MEYVNPSNTNSTELHGKVEDSLRMLLLARRYFEKASWASSKTDKEFKEWLLEHNLDELVLGG